MYSVIAKTRETISNNTPMNRAERRLLVTSDAVKCPPWRRA
jgi:hypothetical protein